MTLQFSFRGQDAAALSWHPKIGGFRPCRPRRYDVKPFRGHTTRYIVDLSQPMGRSLFARCVLRQLGVVSDLSRPARPATVWSPRRGVGRPERTIRRSISRQLPKSAPLLSRRSSSVLGGGGGEARGVRIRERVPVGGTTWGTTAMRAVDLVELGAAVRAPEQGEAVTRPRWSDTAAVGRRDSADGTRWNVLRLWLARNRRPALTGRSAANDALGRRWTRLGGGGAAARAWPPLVPMTGSSRRLGRSPAGGRTPCRRNRM